MNDTGGRTDISSDRTLVRRETIGRLFDQVTERRRQLVSEMRWTSDISKLSYGSMLDMLVILQFDRNFTHRASLAAFWGGEDDRAKAMEEAIIDVLYRVHGCGARNIKGAIERGYDIAIGRLEPENAWHCE